MDSLYPGGHGDPENPCRLAPVSGSRTILALKDLSGQPDDLLQHFQLEQPGLQSGRGFQPVRLQRVQRGRTPAQGLEDRVGDVVLHIGRSGGRCRSRLPVSRRWRTRRAARSGRRSSRMSSTDSTSREPSRSAGGSRATAGCGSGPDREHLAVALQRQPRGDQRARPQRGLHHQRAQRQPGDQPVALREMRCQWSGAEHMLADDPAADSDDASGQRPCWRG